MEIQYFQGLKCLKSESGNSLYLDKTFAHLSHVYDFVSHNNFCLLILTLEIFKM